MYVSLYCVVCACTTVHGWLAAGRDKRWCQASSIGTGTLSSFDSVPPTAPMRLSTLYSFMRPNTTSQAGDSAQRPARRQGQCVQAQTRQAHAPILAALHTHMAAVHSRTAVPCTMCQMAQAGGSCPGSLWSRRGVVSGSGETTVQAQTRAGKPRLPSLLHCTRTWLLCAPELPCLALCARWHRPVAPAQAPCGLAGASSRRPARPHCVQRT